MALSPATGGKGKRKRRGRVEHGECRQECPARRHLRGPQPGANPPSGVASGRTCSATVYFGYGRAGSRYVGRTSQGDGSEVLVASALSREGLGCGHGLTERLAADGFDAVSRPPSENLPGFVGVVGSAYRSVKPTDLAGLDRPGLGNSLRSRGNVSGLA